MLQEIVTYKVLPDCCIKFVFNDCFNCVTCKASSEREREREKIVLK
jgi:hypothetical protein